MVRNVAHTPFSALWGQRPLARVCIFVCFMSLWSSLIWPECGHTGIMDQQASSFHVVITSSVCNLTSSRWVFVKEKAPVTYALKKDRHTHTHHTHVYIPLTQFNITFNYKLKPLLLIFRKVIEWLDWKTQHVPHQRHNVCQTFKRFMNRVELSMWPYTHILSYHMQRADTHI